MHSVEVLIARAADVQAEPESAVLRLASRSDGWAIVDVRRLTTPRDRPIAGFRDLTPPVAEFAARLSRSHPVAYVETDYYGGAGGQAAIAWVAGEISFGPTGTRDDVPAADGAINGALRAIGVDAAVGQDEFDTIGLGAARGTDEYFD